MSPSFVSPSLRENFSIDPAHSSLGHGCNMAHPSFCSQRSSDSSGTIHQLCGTQRRDAEEEALIQRCPVEGSGSIDKGKLCTASCVFGVLGHQGVKAFQLPSSDALSGSQACQPSHRIHCRASFLSIVPCAQKLALNA